MIINDKPKHYTGLSTDTKPNLGYAGNGYVFLESDSGLEYVYSAKIGTWLPLAEPGDAPCVGVLKIEKTSSEGLIDTYTIYYTNGSTTTFDVTNGGEAKTTLEITSEDIIIEDDKIVFNSDIAHEIMSMSKRLMADASIVDPTVAHGKFIGLFTPRAVIDYSSLQEGTTVYEYSTTNWLLDTYRTTYVEFIWDVTTEKLYLNVDHPATYEDHIVGFDTETADGISLTTNADLRTSRINTLHINDFDTVSTYNQPSLEFNANANNELESVEFMQNGYSADFTYTIPKGAKHYVVNELPTQDIDENGDYFVLTESEDARGYLSTDISNLSQSEYPSPNTGALRQEAIVNSSDLVQLQTTWISGGNGYMGDFAVKFNIPCTVSITLNPRQASMAFMYIDVNGVNVKIVYSGTIETYTRTFNVGETLCVRSANFNTSSNMYYKLAIQPYTISGKIPLSTNVEEYINHGNLWFKSVDQKVFMQNVSVSNWVADNTYADYAYRAEITNAKITENSVVSVIYNVAEALSGNYAPVCQTIDGAIYIYSKVNAAITIPTIKEI